jgi:hypothetical protein
LEGFEIASQNPGIAPIRPQPNRALGAGARLFDFSSPHKRIRAQAMGIGEVRHLLYRALERPGGLQESIGLQQF